MTSYTEPSSCAWALHLVRGEVEIAQSLGEYPGESDVEIARRFVAGGPFSPEARPGLRYALAIATRADERRRAIRGRVSPGDLPPRLTVAHIAGEERITRELVARRIARAREEAFGTLSDRQIRRLRPPEQRPCEDCGDPLPLDVPRQRRYCERCSTPAAYTRRSRAKSRG